jgi:mannose-6-phosphate isomerase-like protein (cupin superfamily)
MKWVLAVVAMMAFGMSASAQSAGKSDLFSTAQIQSQLSTLAAQAKAAGSGGTTLADYGSHKVQISVRTSSGGAEIHGHFDDVMIVQQGTATLITGGTIPDAKAGDGGETRGTKIEGGQSRTISAGDIVTVNAGVPHQLIIPAGTTYSAVVVKIKE